VLAETRFRVSQFFDVDRPVVEDANARRQFLRVRSRIRSQLVISEQREKRGEQRRLYLAVLRQGVDL
jgi:hypothetical protein